jgi:hypothetical protein
VEGSSLGLIFLLPVTGLEILWRAAKDLRFIGVLLDVGTKQYQVRRAFSVTRDDKISA